MRWAEPQYSVETTQKIYTVYMTTTRNADRLQKVILSFHSLTRLNSTNFSDDVYGHEINCYRVTTSMDEEKGLRLMDEAKKKVASSESFLGGLFGSVQH